jgi:hypothetical protein
MHNRGSQKYEKFKEPTREPPVPLLVLSQKTVEIFHKVEFQITRMDGSSITYLGANEVIWVGCKILKSPASGDQIIN